MKGDFPEKVEYGFCYCGCNQKTNLAKQNNASKGWKKGEPLRFINGHHCNLRIGKDNPMYGRKGKDAPNWKGGRRIQKSRNVSYILLKRPEHPRSDKRGYVLEHILIVEKALGFSIGSDAVVHHIDGNGLKNELSNLMIFKNGGDHTRFHAKLRRLKNGTKL